MYTQTQTQTQTSYALKKETDKKYAYLVRMLKSVDWSSSEIILSLMDLHETPCQQPPVYC